MHAQRLSVWYVTAQEEQPRLLKSCLHMLYGSIYLIVILISTTLFQMR